jgi:hypothetical protein
MGLRGPNPKSAELRVLEGERAHRPLPSPRTPLAAGMPERPKGMTAAARRVWDAYLDQMMQLGILRPVDAFALQRLCEDVALLQELQGGMRKLVSQRKREIRALSERLAAIERRIRETQAAGTNAGELLAQAAELRELIPNEPPMIALAMSQEGRRLSASINVLASRIQRAEQQYGLTPVSAQRLEGGGGLGMMVAPAATDSIEARLCG